MASILRVELQLPLRVVESMPVVGPDPRPTGSPRVAGIGAPHTRAERAADQRPGLPGEWYSHARASKALVKARNIMVAGLAPRRRAS